VLELGRAMLATLDGGRFDDRPNAALLATVVDRASLIADIDHARLRGEATRRSDPRGYDGTSSSSRLAGG
jgi:hypothetical protein